MKLWKIPNQNWYGLKKIIFGRDMTMNSFENINMELILCIIEEKCPW